MKAQAAEEISSDTKSPLQRSGVKPSRGPGCPMLPRTRLCLEKERCKYQLLHPDKPLQVLLFPHEKSQAPAPVLCVGSVPGHSQQHLWCRKAAGAVFSGTTELLAIEPTAPASVQPHSHLPPPFLPPSPPSPPLWPHTRSQLTERSQIRRSRGVPAARQIP